MSRTARHRHPSPPLPPEISLLLRPPRGGMSSVIDTRECPAFTRAGSLAQTPPRGNFADLRGF